MFCPYCNNLCEAHDRFCSHCGAPLVPAGPKKGRHWVPILIMIILCAFGIGLFFALPGGPANAGGFSTSETPWFRVDNGVLYFNEEYYTGSSELIIPESIGGITITAIGESCFEDCSNLTSIILPPSLRAIEDNAFRGCTSLRGIKIPESVQTIGSGAFADCGALEAVNIYGSIQSIGAGAFSGCNKLYYIYFVGIYDTWTELYQEFINPYTTVFCDDGSYYHGGEPY